MKTPLSFHFRVSFFALLCMLFFISQYGCTLLGYTIGSTLDNKRPKVEKNIRASEVVALRPNTRITVYRKGLDTLTGQYLQVIKMNPAKDTAANALVLDNKGFVPPVYEIPFEQIDHVSVHTRKVGGKAIGLVVGGVIDVGLLILAIKSIDRGGD